MSCCSWVGVLISLSCPSALAEPWSISPQVNQWINCSSPSLSLKSLFFITYLGNKTDQVFFRGGSQTLLSASLSHTFLRAFLTPGTPLPPHCPACCRDSGRDALLGTPAGMSQGTERSGHGLEQGPDFQDVTWIPPHFASAAHSLTALHLPLGFLVIPCP